MNILLTGATSGLGASLVQIFNKNKNINKIICLGRSFSKIKKITKNDKKIIYIKCDLSEKKNIDLALLKIKNVKTIDILINNAGTIFLKKEHNSENIEKTMFVNFLAPVYFVHKLIKKISKSNNKLVVNIVSHAHNVKKIKSDNFIYKNMNNWEIYKRSKFYLILFTFLLQLSTKKKINCICINPGRIKTSFGKDVKIINKIIYIYHFLFGKKTSVIASEINKILFSFSNSRKIYYDLQSNQKTKFTKSKKNTIVKIIKRALYILKLKKNYDQYYHLH